MQKQIHTQTHRAVIPTSKTKIEALQRKENKVWRYLLGIGGYSTVDALRGELGASIVKSRVMETTLQYVRSVMNSKFENIKEMMQDTIRLKTGKWYKTVNSYIEELNIDWTDVYQMSKEELKRKIKNYDTKAWEDNLVNKSTLKFYREGKTKIGYESCYRNNANSMFQARARTNSLKLEEAIGRGNGYYNKNCKLCEQGEENLIHFIAECPALEGKRRYDLFNRDISNPRQRTIELLFKQKKYQEVGQMIKDLWNRRKTILKFKKEEQLRVSKRDNVISLSKSDPGPVGNSHTPRRRGRQGFSISRG